jgi:hypothetical protein
MVMIEDSNKLGGTRTNIKLLWSKHFHSEGFIDNGLGIYIHQTTAKK